MDNLLKVLINLMLLCCISNAASAQNRPNIVLIVADDLGQRDLAIYGNSFIETPNLDRLASKGALFTNGYASGAICSPTRASILTGSSPARIGMTEHLRGNPGVPNTQEVIPPINVRSIQDSFPILAEMLQQQGYQSAHIGKAHFGGNPLNFGYDEVFSGGALPNTYYYPFFNGNPFPELTAYAQVGDYITDVLTDRTLDFMEQQNQDQPFFIHLNYYAPHVPIEGRRDLVEKYEDKASLDPDHVFPVPEYAAMVEGIDENVGRIIQKLESLDLLDNTLVIFTSDNGALHVEEVPAFAKHTPPTDNFPLRAGKGHLYEGGTRVPFIIGGMQVPEALQVETPIISSDLFNTFAILSESNQRTPEGINIYELTQGVNAPDRFLYWHFPHYSPQKGKPMSSIRAGQYKLLKWAERDRIELFDLEADLSESCNLALDEPVLADSLNTLLELWLQNERAKLGRNNPNYDSSPLRVKEPFNYRIDSKLESRNRGNGWAYNWMNQKGQSLFVRAGSLTYDSIDTNGGHLDLQHQGVEAQTYTRPFLNAFNQSQNLWGAFLLEQNGAGDFQLNWTDRTHASIFSLVKNTGSSNYQLSNGNNDSDVFELPIGQTNWVVYEITGFSPTDSVLVWVNPSQDSIPDPVKAKAILTGMDFSSGLGGISLELDQSFDGALDEWTLGFGFQDLSSTFLPDVPSYNLFEPFAYEVGSNIFNKGIDTLGWLGPWRNVGNLQNNQATLEPGNLNLADQTGTNPAYLKLTYAQNNSQIRIDRALQQPIISDGSTYWISFWTQTAPTSANANVANFNLVNSNISANGGHRLSIGRLYATGNIGLITPPNGTRSNTNISDQGLRHLVVRIKTMTGVTSDTVHLWVNPNLTEAPKLEDANATINTSVLKEGIDQIRLRAEGAGQGQTPLRVSFDHIRIGRSWEIGRLLEGDIVNDLDDLTLSSSGVKLFPNPAKGSLSLEFPEKGDYSIKIYTYTGQQVLETRRNTLEGAIQNIDVRAWKDGLYLVQVLDRESGRIETLRLVVKQ